MIGDYNQEVQLEELRSILEDEKSPLIQQQYDALEAAMHQNGGYHTAQDLGEWQTIVLRSLDFFNSLGPNIRILNVCRILTRYDMTTGRHCACGFSFPDTCGGRILDDGDSSVV